MQKQLTSRQRRLKFLSQCAGGTDPDKVIHYLNKASRDQLQGKHHRTATVGARASQATLWPQGDWPLWRRGRGDAWKRYLVYIVIIVGVLAGWSQW